MSDLEINNTLTFDDLLDFKQLSSPHFSPNNNQIVFVITISDEGQNIRKGYIALVTIGDKNIRLLAEGDSPHWSPDGKYISFRANTDGENGIWLYDIKEDKKRFLTTVYDSAYFVDHEINTQMQWHLGSVN